MIVAVARADFVYDPTPAMSIVNGNPNGVWSYGWMTTSFTDFTLLPNKGLGGGTNPQWYGWGGDWTPAVWRNDSGVSGTVPAGWLSMHPGNGNQPAVLRWSAGRPGRYHLVGRFLAGDSGTMQVGVRWGTNWVWQATNAGQFTNDVDVAAGDALDFMVYGGYGSGTTPLAVTITGPDPVVTRYVDAASTSPVAPYTNWATAATSIQDAVALSADYDTVLVRTGLYASGRATTPGGTLGSRVCLTNRVTVRAVDGPDATIIRGAADGGGLGTNAVRGVYIGGGARLEGFTIESGYTSGGGATVDRRGGGVLAVSGTVARCVVRNCRAGWGGGLCLSAAAVAENCLVVTNRADGDGAGVYCDAGGRIDYCTVVQNVAAGAGGGVYLSGGGLLRDAIVYLNGAGSGSNWSASGGGSFASVCTAPTNGLPDATNCTASDPAFVAVSNADFRLRRTSPCGDVGTVLAGVSIDLTGVPRSRDGNGDGVAVPDLGCYEGVARQPFVAVEDEQGRVYAASWNPVSNRFDTLVTLAKIRASDNSAANSRAVAVGDFDGDGQDDIIAARQSGYDRVYPFLFHNDGTNGFVMTQTAGLQGYGEWWAMGLCPGDFDGDGNLDFLSGGDASSETLFLGDGTGKFRREFMGGLPTQSRGVSAADFNHDGFLDFVRGTYSSGNVYLHLGRGDGTFEDPVLLAGVGQDPYGVAAGDFDSDGHPDVIAVQGSTGDPIFLKGRGDGTFTNMGYVASLDNNRHTAWDAYDYDGDGKLDMVTVNHDGRTVRFYKGNGDGTFAAAVDIGAVTDSALAIAAPIPPPPSGTPVAAVSPSAVTVGVGGTVLLNGAASSDAGGSLVSNVWSFGDDTSTGWSNGAPGVVAHSYASAGRYVVRLRVRDDSGWCAVGQATVIVTAAPPVFVSNVVTLPESQAVMGVWTPDLYATQYVSGVSGGHAFWQPVYDTLYDFESGASTGWQFRVGSWSVSSNRPIGGAYSLRQDNEGLDRTHAWLTAQYDGDFEFSADARFESGSGQEMILVIVPDVNAFSYGEVIFRGRGLNDVMIMQSGAETYTRQLPFVPAPYTTYRLKAVYRRGFVEAWMDNYYLGGVRMYAGKTGRLGFATFRTKVVFDNVRVRSLDGTPREAPVSECMETFEDGSVRNWYAGDGTWSVTTNGAITGWSFRQTDTWRDRASRQYRVELPSDFRWEADMKILGGGGEEAILYLWGERGDFRYEVLFRRRGLNDLSVRRYNTGETIIYERPLPFALSLNTPYRIAVARERGWLRFFLGTNDLGRVYDPWVTPLTAGVGCYRTDIVYDNISLRPQGAAGGERWEVGPGTNAFTLTAWSPWGTATAAMVSVVGQRGAAPVANAGGPYAPFDEFTGDVNGGGWNVTLSGTNSTDAESGIARYRWDFGTDTFDGTNLHRGKWVYTATATQSNELKIAGNGYCYTRGAVARAEGLTFEGRVRFTNNDGGVYGFKQDNDNTDWSNFSFAFHNHNDQLYVVQDGNHWDTGVDLAIGAWYGVRIELKAGAGARYWIKGPTDVDWVQVYDTTSGSATSFRRGMLSGAGGTIELDDLREYAAGSTPSFRMYGPGSNNVVLTVWDQALQTGSATATVTKVVNNVPVANPGPNRIFYESNAVDRVWTIAFTGAASTDDHGLWLYEWDWNHNGTFAPSGDEGASVSHAWNTAGVWRVALRVTDHAGQTHVATGVVTTVMGAAPAANTGGPYTADEFTGAASNGAWRVTFNGTGSSDPESQVVQYAWNLGQETFSTPASMPWKWLYSSDARMTNGVLTFDWLAGNNNSGHYCFTRDSFTRVRGLRAETRIRFAAAGLEAMFGFKSDNADNTHWDQWAYGLHNENSSLFYVENGAHVNLGIPISLNTWYDWRIELKEGAGARYYVKRADETVWTLVRDSTAGTATSFRRGYHLYNGSFEADTYTEWAAGPTPTYRFYTNQAGSNTIALTVWDQVLQTNTQSSTLTLGFNQIPVPDAGTDKFGTEATASEGIWWFTFSAAGSGDDHGIMRYEWDWNYNGAFNPSGDEGASVVQSFSTARVGTNTIAVRVWDHLCQTSIDTARVVLSYGLPPVADAGSNMTGEVGYPLPFDGTRSTDDVAVSRYEWDFGDGAKGSGSRPKHIYRATTNYLASLVVYDNAEQVSGVSTITVTVVTSTPPVAVAGGPYTAGVSGPPAYLDGRGSTDNGAPGVVQGVAKYLWDVNIAADSSGDGIPDNDIDYAFMSAMPVYTAAGVYTARLTVVDGAGQSASAPAVVNVVSNLAPHVLCVPFHGSAEAEHPTYSGYNMTLKAVIRDAGAVTCRWDYGDGATSAVQAVTDKYAVQTTHTYSGGEGKSFVATLTAWDANGASASDSYRISIRASNQSARAEIAVDNALWWLHKDQDRTDGHWLQPTENNSTYRPGVQSAALQAFQMNGHRYNGDASKDPYTETLRSGFNYLFHQMSAVAIGLQNGNNPDSDGNGIGVQAGSGHMGYQTGMALDALASAQDMLAMSQTGPTNVRHRFFYDLVVDMVDMYAWGQQDVGMAGRGGWRYGWNWSADNYQGDNSISQWAAIGIMGAENSYGVNVPAFVRSENLIWLNNSYDGAYFRYYANYYPWSETVWHATQPSAMIQLAFDGIKTTNQVWKSAEATLANNWSSIYTGADRDNYYALYAAVKALRLARPRPVTRFEATGVDWYYDPAVGVEKKVLGDQASDGSWDVWYRDSGSGLYRDLSTAWGVMMLTPGIVGQPPVAVLSARQTWKFGVPLRFYASKSFHIDPARRIIRYAWDFDNDGATDYDTVDPDDPAAVRTWSDPHPGTAGDPPQYVTVTLRVKDDNAPALYDEASVTVCVRESPLAPYAVAGGPYVATAGVAVVFNGSQSFDLDTGDSITKYEWDLTHDDVPDLATNAASVRVVYPTPGQYYVGLRVTDQGAFNGGTNLVSEWAYTTVTVLPPDTDGDGMPDAWELQYFGNVTTASASSDWDGDHLPDLYEYLAGTDPTNGLSVLKINRTWKTATNSVTVQWQSQTSHAYRVLRSTNLLVNPPFGVIQTGIPGLPGDTPYTDTNLPSARTFYYRVELDQ